MKFGQFLRKKSQEDRKDEWIEQPINPIMEQRYGDDDDDDDRPGKYPPKKGKPGKEEKSHKEFYPGDILVLVDNKPSRKVPQDAWDFLMTYKEFKVRKINDKGQLDLGCLISKNTPEGGVEKRYMFSPNRFELKNARPEGWVKPVPEGGIKPLEVDEDGNPVTAPGFASEDGPHMDVRATAPGFWDNFPLR
jgi:hypothetical protein